MQQQNVKLSCIKWGLHCNVSIHLRMDSSIYLHVSTSSETQQIAGQGNIMIH
jgi:hypothetical protein